MKRLHNAARRMMQRLRLIVSLPHHWQIRGIAVHDCYRGARKEIAQSVIDHSRVEDDRQRRDGGAGGHDIG